MSEQNGPHLSRSRSDKNDSLISQLFASCTKHRLYHDVSGADEDNGVPDRCQSILTSLRKILPKVEEAYHSKKKPRAEDVGHMCEFYVQVMEGNFCPNAPHLFRLGKGGTQGKLGECKINYRISPVLSHHLMYQCSLVFIF